MTLPPEAQLPEVDPSAAVPAKRSLFTIDPASFPSASTAIGVGVLSASVFASAMYSRRHDSLDVSNFTMGVLASLGLLGIALVARFIVPDAERRASLVSWPGAAGAVGAAGMLAVLINDAKPGAYSSSLALIALSVLGYAGTRAAPFVLTTVLGLALLYGRIFNDLVQPGGDGNGNNQFMIIGAGILLFVAAITAVGWLLPATRVLSSVVVGVGGVVAMSGLLQALTLVGLFTSSGLSGSGLPGSGLPGSGFSVTDGSTVPAPGETSNPYIDDIYMVLAYCAALVVLWTVCALASGHPGFRILIIAITVMSIPMATVALSVQHPTWWEVGLCAVGGGILLLTAVRAKQRPTPAA